MAAGRRYLSAVHSAEKSDEVQEQTSHWALLAIVARGNWGSGRQDLKVAEKSLPTMELVVDIRWSFGKFYQVTSRNIGSIWNRVGGHQGYGLLAVRFLAGVARICLYDDEKA